MVCWVILKLFDDPQNIFHIKNQLKHKTDLTITE